MYFFTGLAAGSQNVFNCSRQTIDLEDGIIDHGYIKLDTARTDCAARTVTNIPVKSWIGFFVDQLVDSQSSEIKVDRLGVRLTHFPGKPFYRKYLNAGDNTSITMELQKDSAANMSAEIEFIGKFMESFPTAFLEIITHSKRGRQLTIRTHVRVDERI